MKVGDIVYSPDCQHQWEIIGETREILYVSNGDRLWRKTLKVIRGNRVYLEDNKENRAKYELHLLRIEYNEALMNLMYNNNIEHENDTTLMKHIIGMWATKRRRADAPLS